MDIYRTFLKDQYVYKLGFLKHIFQRTKISAKLEFLRIFFKRPLGQQTWIFEQFFQRANISRIQTYLEYITKDKSGFLKKNFQCFTDLDFKIIPFKRGFYLKFTINLNLKKYFLKKLFSKTSRIFDGIYFLMTSRFFKEFIFRDI